MKLISTVFDVDPPGKPVRAFSSGAGVLVLASLLLAAGVTPLSGAQSLPPGTLPPLDPPSPASCGSSLKLYDSPFFKICYPRRWHVIRGYGVNYAWWVFSKRKRGERFDIPYIRVIIAKGIAEPHLATQNDSRVLGERTYVKSTNEFKEVAGKKLNGRYWREIAVGPEFDILAWYEQIKMKNLKQFDQALDSFWVPPPPRVRPKPEK
ncbi:MAG: hypothetical protein ACHQKY_02100 [Terriglobia bacterium]